MIKKILIANRGEIAVRIIRACKELNIPTVAVHSTADKESMHVKLADESVCIGSHNPIDSYLNIPSIISAVEITGADAVHPGYGFLAENYKFAQILEEHNIKFIGPRSEIIKKMGDKIEAKKIAKDLGLPVIDGSFEGISDLNEAKVISRNIGFPLLIKAAGGGGGKGMRIVINENELDENIKVAQSEAKKYFGNDEVFIEKFFEKPRHIEVQILSDGKNNTVHLGERDCSIQRRYQKIIEESPCPILNESERGKLLDISVNAVSRLGYEGAGTLEFIYEKGKFYFLEMNTRLQVEHPVTEAVTGIDLVKRQIEIASTGSLDLKQENIKFTGHSIECRVNAEDPRNNFQPSAGTITTYYQPSGPGTRVDSYLFQGSKISPFYDSLVAKLICHGKNRESAITRIKRALDEFIVDGIKTTIDIHKKILINDEFLNNKYDVNWLSRKKFF